MAEVTVRLSTLLADRYRIERQRGEGGMATDYLAEDLRHDRKVALEVLRPSWSPCSPPTGSCRRPRPPRASSTRTSCRSTTAAARRRHGGGTEFLYDVIPHIEDGTLRGKLDREVQLGIDEAIRIATEVADALQNAHEQGVMHRDIKPENIILHNGGALAVDVGIALAEQCRRGPISRAGGTDAHAERPRVLAGRRGRSQGTGGSSADWRGERAGHRLAGARVMKATTRITPRHVGRRPFSACRGDGWRSPQRTAS